MPLAVVVVSISVVTEPKRRALGEKVDADGEKCAVAVAQVVAGKAGSEALDARLILHCDRLLDLDDRCRCVVSAPELREDALSFIGATDLAEPAWRLGRPAESSEGEEDEACLKSKRHTPPNLSSAYESLGQFADSSDEQRRAYG